MLCGHHRGAVIYSYICVVIIAAILLYMCPHKYPYTNICPPTCGQHRLSSYSSYSYISVLISAAILLYMCPHKHPYTSIYVSSYMRPSQTGCRRLRIWRSSTLTSASRCRERGRGCCWCACFIGTNVQTLPYSGEQAQSEGGVLYLLCWCKSTNTD